MSKEEHLDQVEISSEVQGVSAWKDVVAGTVGGIAQVLAGQPFDTTKVRLQSAPEGTYSGAMDVVKQLVKNEGFAGFYKGTLTPLIGIGACVSVQFAVNEGMKRHFEKKEIKSGHFYGSTFTELYLCGAAAGFANAFLASPIELVRIRLQTQTPTSPVKFNGPIDTIKKVIQADGIGHGLFRGLTPTIVREVHGMGMYFLAAEACIKKEMQLTGRARKDVSSWHVCMYGGVAGMAMWSSVYPIDVVKSKFQTDASHSKDRQYTSMLQTLRSIIATNGYKGLFKGFSPTLFRAVPVNAVTFLAFDYSRRLLGP